MQDNGNLYGESDVGMVVLTLGSAMGSGNFLSWAGLCFYMGALFHFDLNASHIYHKLVCIQHSQRKKWEVILTLHLWASTPGLFSLHILLWTYFLEVTVQCPLILVTFSSNEEDMCVSLPPGWHVVNIPLLAAYNSQSLETRPTGSVLYFCFLPQSIKNW